MNTKLHVIKNLVLSLSLFSTVLMSAVPLAVAATPTPKPASPAPAADQCTGGVNACGRDETSCTSSNDCNIFVKYINPFIKFLTILVGVGITLGIIIGGIQYASSTGDPQKVAKAKGRIFAAIAALVMYLFLYALFRFLLPKDALISI